MLRAADFKAGDLPQGAQGLQGPQGLKGVAIAARGARATRATRDTRWSIAEPRARIDDLGTCSAGRTEQGASRSSMIQKNAALAEASTGSQASTHRRAGLHADERDGDLRQQRPGPRAETAVDPELHPLVAVFKGETWALRRATAGFESRWSAWISEPPAFDHGFFIWLEG